MKQKPPPGYHPREIAARINTYVSSLGCKFSYDNECIDVEDSSMSIYCTIYHAKDVRTSITIGDTVKLHTARILGKSPNTCFVDTEPINNITLGIADPKLLEIIGNYLQNVVMTMQHIVFHRLKSLGYTVVHKHHDEILIVHHPIHDSEVRITFVDCVLYLTTISHSNMKRNCAATSESFFSPSVVTTIDISCPGSIEELEQFFVKFHEPLSR